ncbi:DUF4311 domain-containing protein [Salmonella enterica subsp. enterica]|nr:hypothetical protein [Salmonella enterica subsp. enterica serovar Potsdam]EDW2621345.1 DUF4311 domain-containing protein [Salmonella enterica subsp. enterica]EBV2339056.1 hypothetical protein [Salmonella enterica subsp. enterica serovar Potsdam]EBV2471586.1 hypothetical protein [Salmonella enterica subsp. enterica serovar Potsdam]ECH0879193.1 DUF4311 domain-containing protein [Salmonella enterica subsp. enterica serovar Potsdam]
MAAFFALQCVIIGVQNVTQTSAKNFAALHTKVMMVAIVLLFVLSGFFRGFDMKMIESFNMTVPNWLELIHNSLSGK